MKVELFRYADLSAETIGVLTQIRNAAARFDSPFFDLEFARQVSLVREDTRIAVVSDDNGLAGFWAMQVRPDKWARPIGATFSDWHGPVMRKDLFGVDPAHILDLCGLKGMTVNGLQLEGLVLAVEGETVPIGQATIGHGGAEEFLTNQRECFPKYAKNIRRAERMVERDFGGLFFTADDPSDEALNWTLESKSAQYRATGFHDVLKPDWAQALMRNLHACRTPGFGGRLSTLRFGDRLVAAELDLVSDQTIHGWITVFDDEYSRYSPGHLLIRNVICDAERTGHTTIDVGGGDSAYKKYYWTYSVLADAGIVRASHGMRPLAGSWRIAEKALPAKLSNVMARMRRRTDQIAGTELSVAGRVSGFLKALSRRPRNR